ncbi:hypothetical protein M3O96_17210 [Aquiflexum sp. TKW24L]|uniref:hypothetical protein n=1 Tax=Aquiflexum sp. TKW24L TaxID=2942212 RepID=UPI0020BFF366|nr:hypothetical protein [Aquiflexum sp. TKW24L]MCL6260845.1 hypothetical protein [Aquiflexum sp. TKW24L]
MALNQSHISLIHLIVLSMGLVMGLVPKPKVSAPDFNMESILKVETDSIRYEIWLVSDPSNQPDHYYGEIFTPVCYSRTCYPVFINYRWDLLGNYVKYELSEGRILTKSDHAEFDKKEYKKLEEILSNENSILKNYRADQLVTSTETVNPTGVDAVTGATIKSIQREVISGAVYSCYTLWHIAHGDISGKLKQHTESLLTSDSLLIQFLQSSNHHYQYWAIDKTLIGGQIKEEKYKKPMLSILNGENVFAANYLLRELPSEIFNDKDEQSWLIESFLAAPYPLQLSILKKFNQIYLFQETSAALVSHLLETSDEQKKLIFGLLTREKELDEASQITLTKFLLQPKWEANAFRILRDQNSLFPAIKGELTAFTEKNKSFK